MVADHEKNGISGGIVSNLESIFYNDPMEGDEELAEKLPENYLLALTHNPMLPHAANEISKNGLNAAAVRLFPCYHGYRVNGPQVVEFCRAAAGAGLLIYIIARMDDMRFDYLFRQHVTDFSDITELAEKVPEAGFVVSQGSDIYKRIDEINKIPNLYADNAYIPDVVFGYRNKARLFKPGKLLFATHYPMQCMESNTIAIKLADIGDDEKENITRNNIETLLRKYNK